jgi:hypothetical protein
VVSLTWRNLLSSSSVSKIMTTKGEPGTCSPLHLTCNTTPRKMFAESNTMPDLNGIIYMYETIVYSYIKKNKD